MPPRKTNNAAKFIVSLKQNNSEGFTINGFSRILSSHIRPLNLCKMPLHNFGQKREIQYLEKYALLCRVFKFVIKQNSLVHYLRGNFFAYTIELIGFKLLFANSWLLRRKEKFITPEKSLCLSKHIIRKASSVRHKYIFFYLRTRLPKL